MAPISITEHPRIRGLVNLRDDQGQIIQTEENSDLRPPTTGYTGGLNSQTPYNKLSAKGVDDTGDVVSFDILAEGSGKTLTTRLQGPYVPGTSYIDGFQRVEEVNLGDGYLILPRSNIEFAGQVFANTSATSGAQFIPYHGQVTALPERAVVYKTLLGDPIDMPGVGETLDLPHGLVVDQEINGKHPSAPATQVKINVLTKFYTDGLIEVSGKWTFLVNTKVGSVYAPMIPFQRDDIDSLEYSGGTIALDTSDPGSTQTFDIPQMDGGLLKASNKPSIRIAWDWDDPISTLRRDKSDRKSSGTINFIQRRTDGINKVYHHVWNPNTIVPAGTTWDFKARWRYMEVN